MTNRITILLLFLILMISCTKFENAEMTERNSFVHFYSSGTNFVGSTAEIDSDGGYILSGEIRYPGHTDAIVIKTDARGHKVWEKIITNGIINAIRPTSGGYILAGDHIDLNPSSPEVSQLINTSARLMVMDKTGTIVGQHVKNDSVLTLVNNDAIYLKVDYHADAFTLDASNNVILLGSFRAPGKNESSFVSAFDPNDLTDSLWYRSYVPNSLDYINCKALHLTPSDQLVWASKTFELDNNLSREYLSISTVNQNSTYVNNMPFGHDDVDDLNYSAGDMREGGLGYGLIGTYAEPSGINSNIYFLRIDNDGNIVAGSERYIDGENLLLNNSLLDADDKMSSSSSDEGMAIMGAPDGYILAGSMTSTPRVGNGGKDIILIKLDHFGKLLWKKLIGGTGDETVHSIRVTADGGFLICGSNTINGLSSIMLMKTDSNGNIEN